MSAGSDRWNYYALAHERGYAGPAHLARPPGSLSRSLAPID
jgi:hypothetical protein